MQCELVWEIAEVYEALFSHEHLPDLRILVENKGLINNLSWILQWNEPAEKLFTNFALLRKQAQLDFTCIKALTSLFIALSP